MGDTTKDRRVLALVPYECCFVKLKSIISSLNFGLEDVEYFHSNIDDVSDTVVIHLESQEDACALLMVGQLPYPCRQKTLTSNISTVIRFLHYHTHKPAVKTECLFSVHCCRIPIEYRVSKKKLKDLFSEFGKVREVFVLKDKKSAVVKFTEKVTYFKFLCLIVLLLVFKFVALI